MIEKLTYKNAAGKSLEFSVSSEFFVNISKDSTGLFDVSNSINSIGNIGAAGSTYISHHVAARDIEIVGTLNSTNKENRRQLKELLLTTLDFEQKGTLEYTLDTHKRLIDCHVAASPSFAPAVLLEQFIISFSCLNPFWRDEKTHRQEVTAWQGYLKFPVSIHEQNWAIGRRTESKIINCYNAGSVKTGIHVIMTATDNVNKPKLLNIDTGEFIQLNYNMKSGDTLEVFTGYGEKKVLLNGEDAFYLLTPASSYIWLKVGDNLFKQEGETLDLDVAVEYQDCYLGA